MSDYISTQVRSWLCICLNLLASVSLMAQTGKPHYISIQNSQELHAYFRYAPDRPIVISGHRGGMLSGYPENCIESFEKTLSFAEAFFEIDPRLTKDSVIVLMHDETIDRTTTGKGKVSDYTYAELQQFNLVDRDGKVQISRFQPSKPVWIGAKERQF